MTRTYFIPFFLEVTVTRRPVLSGLTLSASKFESVVIKPLWGTGLLLVALLLIKAWS
jgi:hypothetical protein